MPTLEEAFGERRMAWLMDLFRTRFPALVDDVVEEAIFDRPGHFRLSEEFRRGMTQFVHDGKPVQFLMDGDAPRFDVTDDISADQTSIDCMIEIVLRRAKVLPPDSQHIFADTDPQSDMVLWRWWRGDDGQRMGWINSPKERNRYPRPAWPEPPV
ncbi:hypothetical protein [Rhodopseudomonas sp.]|uniref:hypothetical protein n=1 Tax=Rhodopseudomonas sp. TaxID=1078 RepID=UPI0039E31E91